MYAQRISVKFYVDDPSDLELKDYVPVFHGWIQRQVTDELLIDVADYKHLYHGPGIILVGHEGDYGLDLADGRPGLRYTRKRTSDTPLESALAVALERALAGCARIEADPSLRGAVTFARSELEVQIQDRLRLPNMEEGRAKASRIVNQFFEEWYPDSTVSVTATERDVRHPLQLQIRVFSGPDLTAPRIRRVQPVEA